MRAHRHLFGASVASLALLVALPSGASAAARPFIAPQPRPTEGARPTDNPDPNRNAYTVPEAAGSPACTRHFCVHWVTEGIDAPRLVDRDGDGLPDYVQRVQDVAERVYEVENRQLGWRQPKPDGRKGGRRGKTDIYVSQLGGALFGYAAPDRGQATRGHRIQRRLHGYLVIDNDYARREFPGTTQRDDLEVTLAHEYNHILQFGYDAYQDPWFAEATATWMEDRVFDGIDDYRRYVRRWVKLYETPLTSTSIKEYGSAVWNQWLARTYGNRVVRSAWSRALRTKPGGFSVSAYDSAIRSAGRSDFSRDFARFTVDTAEWRTRAVFSEANGFPDVRRQGRLPLDGRNLRRLLNHTTAQLLRVRPVRGRLIAVRAVAPRGNAAGLALVGRIGSERRGRVVSRLRYAPRGGVMTVRLPDPGRFQRITAVVVNADATARGFSSRRLDWLYLRDAMPFEISARLVR